MFWINMSASSSSCVLWYSYSPDIKVNITSGDSLVPYIMSQGHDELIAIYYLAITTWWLVGFCDLLKQNYLEKRCGL